MTGCRDYIISCFGRRGIHVQVACSHQVTVSTLVSTKRIYLLTAFTWPLTAGCYCGNADSGPMSAPLPPAGPRPDAWAAGLTRSQQQEWLVDCYRMRVDDDMCWGGGNLHGLYEEGE